MIRDNKNYPQPINILNNRMCELLTIGSDYISQSIVHADNYIRKDVSTAYSLCCTCITTSKPQEINKVNIWYNKNINVGGSS